jgi:hypothetical protein
MFGEFYGAPYGCMIDGKETKFNSEFLQFWGPRRATFWQKILKRGLK